MNPTTHGDLEQQAYRAWWGEGLLDLFVGAGVSAIGLAWILDGVVFGAIIPALLVPLWQPLRQKLIEPRLGYVEFTSKREVTTTRFVMGMLAVGIGLFTLAIVAGFLVPHGSADAVTWIAGLPAALLALPAFAFTLHSRCLRYAVFGLALLFAGLETAIHNWEPGPGLLAVGVVIVLSGSVRLVRFVRQHPLGDRDPQ